jgi:hypothetical protein
MRHYEMEELLPIVARLADQYTSKESSSIRFETARQLMEAVIYCIHHAEGLDNNDNGLKEEFAVRAQGMSAEEAYVQGYHVVVDKVKRANVQYTTLLSNFNWYHNQAYYDTFIKGMPSFFLYYDAKFAPQNHILTLDYPTLRFIGEVQGIDAIERFLRYTEYEQEFLRAFPEEYVMKVLELYHKDYEELLINVCSLVLRNVLVCMWMNKPLMESGFPENAYNSIREQIRASGQEGIKEILTKLLERLLKQGYKNHEELMEYLSYDIKEFSVELYHAAQHGGLEVLLGGC